MISAVAARKAALAKSQGGTPTTEPESSRQSSAQDEASSSKRKSPGSEPQGHSSSQKRAKLEEKETKQKKVHKKAAKEKSSKPLSKAQRYFAESSVPPQDLFQNGEDVIDLGSDSVSGSDAPRTLNVRMEREGEDLFSSEVDSEEGEEASKRSQRGDSMDVDITQMNLSTLFPHTATALPSNHPNTPLSTFQPAIDENVFSLLGEEVSQLKLPPSPSSSHTHSSPSTLVLIGPHETLCLLGTCNLTVLHGSILILGSTLYPSTNSHRIYAPKSSPLPVIRCSFTKTKESLLGDVDLPSRVSIDDDIRRHGAVLLLQELRTGIEGLGKICRPFLNAFQQPKWQPANAFKLPGLCLARGQLSDVAPFILPPSWSEALERCTSSHQLPDAQDVCNVYLIKGPKNTGKSTFSRTLLNKLLETYERVAFLECDLGQSEFTPGGMVALNLISRPIFGPPFTHPTLPVAAHYIGSSTPRSSPSHYLEAIQALLQVYRLEIQTPSDERLAQEGGPGMDSAQKIQHIIPLIVNTMGWSKGLGSDLNQKIEEWATPTDVFTFDPVEEMSGPSQPLAIRRQHRQSFGAFNGGSMDGDTGNGAFQTYSLDAPILSEGGLSSQYTAADHRTLTLLSYFHAVFPSLPNQQHQREPLSSSSLPLVEELSLGQATAELWNTNTPLVAMRPYEVDASQALNKVVLTGSGSEDVVEGEAGRVLNGAVVGLVSCTEGAFAHWSNPEEDRRHSGPPVDLGKLPYTQHCPPPDPANATCVGLGLVRAVHPRHIDSPASGSDGVGQGQARRVDLQLLTPIPPQLLSSTRVFVKGEMELPIWGMLDFRAWNAEGARRDRDEDGVEVESETGVVEMEQGQTAYLQWGKSGVGVVGSEKRRVRRNLMRRGQM
ncbi:hypothetical protein FA13DRAFT_1669430 [Coprinellus micaceus]|uniref:Polynucleotide 5'-hydroxyl-kinase GRC3 n=1 Tax=Coprinellus micaceus TaxID=71717 RepID=A0A4Y7ST54_COPMI|nr:hypothetical protein FA13DRAFT_1669430 [Coprinellus micaceus]